MKKIFFIMALAGCCVVAAGCDVGPGFRHTLSSGYYQVSLGSAGVTSCSSDLGSHEGARWSVEVSSDSLTIEGAVVTWSENQLSGTFTQVVNQESQGWACTEQVDYVYGGEVLADDFFEWIWNGTRTEISGGQCSEMLESASLPCTYESMGFTLVREADVS